MRIRSDLRCLFLSAVLALGWPCSRSSQMSAEEMPDGVLKIVSVNKIWDKGPHNAFTDLVRFEDKWYCAFREAEGHVRGGGTLRVLVSGDGEVGNR